MVSFIGTLVWFLQEPHDAKSHEMAFFIVTTMKTSNITEFKVLHKFTG
jgi:hypothetical protein